MTSLEVIGAGLGRTGTKSLKEALEILGHEPCHHMMVALEQQNDKIHLWKNVAQGELETNEHLKTIFEGFKATMDYPGCVFFEEFMEWNPKAKVILSVRDNPEMWVASVRKTIFPTSLAKKFLLWLVSTVHLNNLYYIQFIHKTAVKKHQADALKADTDLVKFYEDWNRHVTQTVPKEKLLIFNVKQGWEPLCEFLGVPVPDKPFPVSNDQKEFQKKRSLGVMLQGALKGVLVISLVVVGVAVGYQMFASGQ